MDFIGTTVAVCGTRRNVSEFNYLAMLRRKILKVCGRIDIKLVAANFVLISRL